MRNLSAKTIVISLAAMLLAGGLFVRQFKGSLAVLNDSAPASETSSRSSPLDEPGWPQLRGPTFDSISQETGLADSWPDSGPPVLWTRELGQGYSSFAAVGNQVFTQCQSLYQQSLVCLNAETGDTIWSHHYDWPYEGGGLYPGPRSTPTWHQGRLYFAAPDGTVGCLEAQSGKPVWSCNPKKQFHGRGTDFGYACSPVVVDDRVIIPVGGNDASVVALRVQDGSLVWKSGESSASYATPLPIRWRGRSLVITPLENSIAAFDARLGTPLWEIEFSEGYDEHSAAPIYQEPLLCVASPFRAGAKCYKLMTNSHGADDQSESDNVEPMVPKLVWETPKFSNDVVSSVLVGGRLYGFDLKDAQSRIDRPSRGEFRCLDFQSGKIVWSTNRVGQASIIVADQKLILFTDSGELVLLKAGTDDYTEMARTQIFRDEVCWTSPALHRNCLYLRTQTRAACIYLGSAPYQARRPMKSVDQIPRGRTIDAKILIGGEREFPATVPEWSEFRSWYLWSVGCLVLASVASLLLLVLGRGVQSYVQKRIATPQLPEETVLTAEPVSITTRIARVGFWLTTFASGILGSPLINQRQDDYVLLWPLALWTVFQLTVNEILWAERHPNRAQVRWISRGCGLVFVGSCFLYFSLCRALGYSIEWSFLIGFLPAFFVAVWAGRFLAFRRRFWPITDLCCSALSFTTYFWSSVMFIKWKLVVGS